MGASAQPESLSFRAHGGQVSCSDLIRIKFNQMQALLLLMQSVSLTVPVLYFSLAAERTTGAV